MSKTKEYSNDDVTVVWEAEKCFHSAVCAKNLRSVFKPNERPWIKIDAASSEDIVETVKKCPSGALTYYMNTDSEDQSKEVDTKVEVLENGPLLVHGNLAVTLKDGSTESQTRTTAFCRCGASLNKPYCDGAHRQHKFIG